jgi:predicted branched-subunit amino acid permease
MKDLVRGMWASAPLAPAIVAFGLLYGMMARQVGFAPWEAWAMSVMVHAGSLSWGCGGTRAQSRSS